MYELPKDRKFFIVFQHVIDFQDDVALLPAGAALFRRFQQAVKQFGVDDISYTWLPPIEIGNLTQARNLLFTTYNAAMLQQLGGFQGFANDLTRLRAEQGVDTVWTDDTAWNNASPIQMQRCHLASEAGVINGYTHSLGKRGQMTASVGLRLDGLKTAEFQKNWQHLSKSILPIVQIMHNHFTKHHLPQHYKLSTREKDVLSWLAMGLRPDEIAEQLNIGYRSVDKYIVSAKEKMGAHSRDHAVARALTLGLLDL